MTTQTYALIANGAFAGRLESFEADDVPQLAPEKGLQWVPYLDDPMPEFDPMTAAAERTSPALNEAGALVQGWTVRPLTLDEIRVRRQPLLDQGDLILRRHYSQEHYGIATSITAEKATEWAAYLQALRDITLQEPAALTWPTPPA